jgi:3-hydroxymyristoyl/3-hydroxydecanoyl-(acyl carrier protein) dehydratase
MKGLLQIDGNTLTASFIFPEDFAGFRGHFPAQKVLPGVCHIQCVTLMFERAKKRPVILKEIIQAKYISPVLPSEELVCICSDGSKDGGDIILKATLSRDNRKVSEVKLRVSI